MNRRLNWVIRIAYPFESSTAFQFLRTGTVLVGHPPADPDPLSFSEVGCNARHRMGLCSRRPAVVAEMRDTAHIGF
jgi:hypothetical protein